MNIYNLFTSKSTICFIGNLISAGFPSPADNFLEDPLNLHELVVKNPTATFFIRVIGDSMQEAGIASGDILVVDRSLTPKEGKIVIAVIDGEFTVKRIHFTPQGGIVLKPANPAYSALKVNEGSDFQVWGVVSYVIHKV